MSLEYAAKGLIGVLTPQANTTVEPEFALLMPPGYACINGRLTSALPVMEDRSIEYLDQIDRSIGQFANAPIQALAFACTGTSYLVGKEKEDRVFKGLSDRLGIPATSAALAIVDSLRTLGAERIGLVSPYEGRLNAACTPYWESRGFTVVEKVAAARKGEGFHPIYSLTSAIAEASLDAFTAPDLDAVVMLGTGMPTVGPIRRRSPLGRAPVLSSVLCLAWRSAAAASGRALDRDDLLSWTRSGKAFVDRDLTGVAFRNVRLANARFDDVNLAGSRFDDINFTGAEITHKCNFTGMRLDGVPVGELIAAYRRQKG